MSNTLNWIDGKWVHADDLKISVFDITVLRGFGVFDFARTYNRKPFLLEDHLDRLYSSLAYCELSIPYTRETLTDVIHEGIAKNPELSEIYIKIIVTGGISADAITPTTPSVILIFLQAATPVQQYYIEGIKLMTVQHKRYLANAKTLNYLSGVLNLKKAKAQGAQEILYMTEGDGSLLEGATVNFFALIQGKLYTAEDDILYGVTRKFVLKLANDLGLQVIEGPLNHSQIDSFEEAFITSTTREVMPVVQIDEKKIGSGQVGPVTKRLIEAFEKVKQ